MTERDVYDCGRCYQLRVERDRASQQLSEALQELRRVETVEAAIRADERERWKQSHGGLVAEIEREIRAKTARSVIEHIEREFGGSR